MVSYYSPRPKRSPICLPKQIPIKTVPSALGDEGLVANWLFYYLRGGDHLHDFSPYKNHGTLNGPVWKDGRYGWALKFDGVDDYIKVPDDDSLDFDNTDFTLAHWVKIEGNLGSRQMSLMKKTDTGVSDDETNYNLYIQAGSVGSTGNELMFQIGNGTNNDPGVSSLEITDNDWHYVVVSWDNSAQAATMYLDGNSDTLYFTINPASNTYPLFMGSHWAADGSQTMVVNGKISIIRIYDTAKSSSWVSRRFNRTRGIFGI